MRDTCNKVWNEEKGCYEKSSCEREKNKKYQRLIRKRNKEEGIIPRQADKSVAVSSLKHLEKYKKIKKHKRFCLKCNKHFTALGKYIRLCDPCKIENNRMKF